MKTLSLRRLLSFAVIVLPIAIGTTACNDRSAEKKIAELESRLAELEGTKKNTANPLPGTEVAQPEKPEEKPEGPLPAFAFKSLEHDFGTINEGQIVEHTFAFTNTGDAPLIIQNAQPSCGCTAPDWTKTPIPPGGTGFVKAKFDSNGKPNIQTKSITVTANTWPKQTVIRFKAMVTPKSEIKGPVK